MQKEFGRIDLSKVDFKNINFSEMLDELEMRAILFLISVTVGAICAKLIVKATGKRKKYSLEILAEAGSYLDNLPSRNFGLPKDCKLDAILRGGKRIRFSASTCIQPGDVLVVKTSDKYLARLYRFAAGHAI